MATLVGQFDPIHEFHVGTFINFMGMARLMVGDEEPKWSAGGWRERLAIESVNHQRSIAHRRQRHARMKVISSGMQTDVGGVGRDGDEF